LGFVSGEHFLQSAITTTGALTTSGSIDITNNGATAGFITLEEPNGDSTVKIASPALAGNYTLTLPEDDGSADEVLKTDGSGNLSWGVGGGGGGAVTAKIISDSSDYALADENAGGTQITGLTWTTTIPTEGVIRLVFTNLEMDEDGTDGEMTFAIEVNGTKYWAKTGTAAQSQNNNMFQPSIRTRHDGMHLRGGRSDGNLNWDFMWDISYNSMSTGSQTINVYMGDGANGNSGVTITGTTEETRALIEIVDGS
jgi:hypothetical protein